MAKSLKERDIRLKEQGNLYLRAKGVTIGKASSRVLTFSAGFRLGSRFAYFIYIANCIVNPNGTYDESDAIQVCSVAIYLLNGVDSSRTLCMLESVNFACDEMPLAFMIELSLIKKS